MLENDCKVGHNMFGPFSRNLAKRRLCWELATGLHHQKKTVVLTRYIHTCIYTAALLKKQTDVGIVCHLSYPPGLSTGSDDSRVLRVTHHEIIEPSSV